MRAAPDGGGPPFNAERGVRAFRQRRVHRRLDVFDTRVFGCHFGVCRTSPLVGLGVSAGRCPLVLGSGACTAAGVNHGHASTVSRAAAPGPAVPFAQRAVLRRGPRAACVSREVGEAPREERDETAEGWTKTCHGEAPHLG